MRTSKYVYIFWISFILLAALLLFVNLPEYLSKKILGAYLIAGVIISYKFHIEIFRGKIFLKDKSKAFDKDSTLTNIVVLIFAIFLFFV